MIYALVQLWAEWQVRWKTVSLLWTEATPFHARNTGLWTGSLPKTGSRPFRKTLLGTIIIIQGVMPSHALFGIPAPSLCVPRTQYWFRWAKTSKIPIERVNFDPNPVTLFPSSVVFSLYSPDGEEGYPGHVVVSAKFTLSPDTGDFSVVYTAMPSQKTPINLAQNIFFNLAGHGKGK